MCERRITLGHRPLRILYPADPARLIDAALDACNEGQPDAPAPGASDLRLPYWMEIWPAAVGLGRQLVEMPLAGRRVLELGAGVGVAGLAAALAGAEVLLTDREPVALAVARRNAERNGLPVATRLLDWNAPPPAIPCDWIIAADVLYERELAEPVARLLAALLDGRNQALIADPERPFQEDFEAALRARGLRARRRPTHFFWDGRSRTVTLYDIRSDRRRIS